MLAFLLFATIVASAMAMPPPKEKVHFQPVPKAVPHEEPFLHGDQVPLLKQQPVIHKQVVTVVDEEPVIIKKPKHVIIENPVRVHYPVDKPFIQHKRIIKPIHKERTIVLKKQIDVPRPIIKTKTIGVPQPYVVKQPFKRVKTVTQVVERVHKIPRPVPKPELQVVHRDRPFPVENLVISNKPRLIEHPYEEKVPIVETITNVIREPIAHPKDKVLTVEHPVLNHQKVPYFPKGAGGYGGHGHVRSYEESQGSGPVNTVVNQGAGIDGGFGKHDGPGHGGPSGLEGGHVDGPAGYGAIPVDGSRAFDLLPSGHGSGPINVVGGSNTVSIGHSKPFGLEIPDKKGGDGGGEAQVVNVAGGPGDFGHNGGYGQGGVVVDGGYGQQGAVIADGGYGHQGGVVVDGGYGNQGQIVVDGGFNAGFNQDNLDIGGFGHELNQDLGYGHAYNENPGQGYGQDVQFGNQGQGYGQDVQFGNQGYGQQVQYGQQEHQPYY